MRNRADSRSVFEKVSIQLGNDVMSKDSPLTPDDFPVEADKAQLKTQDGKPVAVAQSEATAQDIADRLNEQAAREEEDRWSA